MHPSYKTAYQLSALLRSAIAVTPLRKSLQLQKRARQFAGFDDVTATLSTSVNHPAPAVLRDGAAIAPGPARLTELVSD